MEIWFEAIYLNQKLIINISSRFRWVKAPTDAELSKLTHTIAYRIGRYLERQGWLARDAENSYLALENLDEEPMDQLRGYSITYRIAVGSQQGCKVFTLQTLPGSDEPFSTTAGNIAGFSLHARLAALVPRPRVNLIRYHGVFAPNSKYRALITPAKRGIRKQTRDSR